METVQAGVAVRDITPSAPVAMGGFAARTALSSGVHDPLLVHALAIGETVLITVDVVGMHEEDCARIRRRCNTAADGVVVHATHTHGGPVSMRGRIGSHADAAWIDYVVDACVGAANEALAGREPTTLWMAEATGLGVARNRRRDDGPVDDRLPLLVVRHRDGSALAAVASYACHPVVLGSDNKLLTADYPGAFRRRLGSRLDGAPVLFVTGCAGDANTGHRASDSFAGTQDPRRTFEECERIGVLLADAAHELVVDGLRPCSGPVLARAEEVVLDLDVPAVGQVEDDILRWRQEQVSADQGMRRVLESWIGWGETLLTNLAGNRTTRHWTAAVSIIRWGEFAVIGLPGEPFATTAHEIRDALGRTASAALAITAGYSNGCPGYLPCADEYRRGGYEVVDAHRYYGMPGPFAPGSAERLSASTIRMLEIFAPG